MSRTFIEVATGKRVEVPDERVEEYFQNPDYRPADISDTTDRVYNPPPGVNTTQEPGPWTNAVKPADASEVPANQPTNTGEPSAEVPDEAVVDSGAEAEVEAAADEPKEPA